MVPSWVHYERICQVSCIEHENHPFLSHSYKIIYWHAVDKLEKGGDIMFMVFFCLRFLKMVEKTIMGVG